MSKHGFVREHVALLQARIREERRFIQVLGGPRQVGKTTIARQAIEPVGSSALYASADGPAPPDARWIDQVWDSATAKLPGGVLVIDEVQKIHGWAEVVKARWDDDTHHGRGLRVVLLGSAPVLVQRGLTESLAGRFERIAVPHWSFGEMRAAFGFTLDQFVAFGGYPGPAPLVEDEPRWRAYIRDSIVETTVARDLLLLHRVDKPALLRQLFDLACAYSAKELSFNKMLGQLQDAGNTVTLAHYLDLLAAAGLVSGLRKFAGDAARRRGSSPRLLVHDTALATARSGRDAAHLRADGEAWGQWVESAVGAHLLHTAGAGGPELSWWRDGRHEVDFVLRHGERVTAIEVKTTPARTAGGLSAFQARFPGARALVVGPGGVPLEAFLAEPAGHWLR